MGLQAQHNWTRATAGLGSSFHSNSLTSSRRWAHNFWSEVGFQPLNYQSFVFSLCLNLNFLSCACACSGGLSPWPSWLGWGAFLGVYIGPFPRLPMRVITVEFVYSLKTWGRLNSHAKRTVRVSPSFSPLLHAVRTSAVTTAPRKVTMITFSHNLSLAS